MCGCGCGWENRKGAYRCGWGGCLCVGVDGSVWGWERSVDEDGLGTV